MKVSEAIIKLSRIMRDHGDINLCVDTEAAAFSTHVVDISDITHVGNKKVVEAVGDRRADGDLHVGKQPLHRLRHQVCRRVAQNIEAFR